MTGYLYRGSLEFERINAEIMAWRAAGVVLGRKRPPGEWVDGIPPHGTEARARWDQRHGANPCPSCRSAANLACQVRKERRKSSAPDLGSTGGRGPKASARLDGCEPQEQSTRIRA